MGLPPRPLSRLIFCQVSSLSLWKSPFFTRQLCWFWSTLGILFPQYPPYLVSLLSTTWGGARWETSNSTRVHCICFLWILWQEECCTCIDKSGKHSIFSDTVFVNLYTCAHAHIHKHATFCSQNLPWMLVAFSCIFISGNSLMEKVGDARLVE